MRHRPEQLEPTQCPPPPEFPKTKKKRPASRRKQEQGATTKGVVNSIPRPAEKGKGFPHEQHRNSEQGQRASGAAPHGR
nr:MAG TPA: hypothetical protein [Caudoviricetes sp.]